MFEELLAFSMRQKRKKKIKTLFEKDYYKMPIAISPFTLAIILISASRSNLI